MSKKKEIKKDLETSKDLKILADSNGGKVLKKGLLSDIVGAVDRMIANRDKNTLQEFVSAACDIKTKLDVLRALDNAKSNVEFLEEAFQAAAQEEEE